MTRLAAILLLAASACGSAVDATVTVFAASSLTTAFESIAHAFEEANPGTTVRLSFGGSTSLARQIAGGAPADVFASADAESLAVVGDLAADAPVTFAQNRMAIAVAAGNPHRIAGPADLARPGLVVVLCAPDVPCGRRTAEMLAATGVTVRPASREESVRGALSKVVAGEADAAVVYATDTRDAATADAIAIPDAQNVTSDYPVVALRRARDLASARAFVTFLRSERAQAILRDRGFETP